MTPIRMRRLARSDTALLGSMMLGLRRLEKKALVPLVDLAVLEEALEYYTTRALIPMRFQPTHGSVETSVSGFDHRVLLPTQGGISMHGTIKTHKYVVSVATTPCRGSQILMHIGFGAFHWHERTINDSWWQGAVGASTVQNSKWVVALVPAGRRHYSIVVTRVDANTLEPVAGHPPLEYLRQIPPDVLADLVPSITLSCTAVIRGSVQIFEH